MATNFHHIDGRDLGAAALLLVERVAAAHPLEQGGAVHPRLQLFDLRVRVHGLALLFGFGLAEVLGASPLRALSRLHPPSRPAAEPGARARSGPSGRTLSAGSKRAVAPCHRSLLVQSSPRRRAHACERLVLSRSFAIFPPAGSRRCGAGRPGKENAGEARKCIALASDRRSLRPCRPGFPGWR